jgi:hypothetical protein
MNMNKDAIIDVNNKEKEIELINDAQLKNKM